MRRWIFAFILGLPLAAYAQAPQALPPKSFDDAPPLGEPDHEHMAPARPEPPDTPIPPNTESLSDLIKRTRIAKTFTQDEAMDILNRHRHEIQHLPGVKATSITVDGLTVYYESEEPPKGIPAQFEGLPVILKPWEDGDVHTTSHSATTIMNPYGSGQCVTENPFITPLGAGTSGPLTLTHGLLGMYLPSHMLTAVSTTIWSGNEHNLMCAMQPNCGFGDTANCNRYAESPLAQNPAFARIFQGLSTGVSRGWPQIWDAWSPNLTTSDVAWTSVDDNFIPNDYSLGPNAFRQMPLQTRPNGASWTGENNQDIPVGFPPVVGADVQIDTADCTGGHGTHTYVAHVNDVGLQINNVGYTCRESGAGQKGNLELAMRLGQDDPVLFLPGDSGSPVYYVDTSGSYLWGIFSAARADGRVGYAVPTAKYFQYAQVDHFWDRTATTLQTTFDIPIQGLPNGAGLCSWAKVTNTGPVAAKEVEVEKLTAVPHTLNYWSPSGDLNTPFTVQSGQTASFPICLNYHPSYFSATVELNVWGRNALSGVGKYYRNSLSGFWQPSAPPLIPTTCEVVGGGDILHTNGPNGTGKIYCAASNAGPSGSVTMRPNMLISLPYILNICDSTNANPPGSCLAPPTSQLTYSSWPTNQIRTFTISVTGQGVPIPLDHYYRRISLLALNPNGWMLGGISVSVTTN